MSAVTTLLLANWQAFVGLLAAVAGAIGLYFKGRSDARRSSTLEDLTHANAIRKAGAAARASIDDGPDRLRSNDGWRRD